MNKLTKSLGLVLFSMVSMAVLLADEVLPKVVAKVGENAISINEYVKRLIDQDGTKTMENIIVEKVIELELIEMKLSAVTENEIDLHINLMEKQLQSTQGPYANIHTFLKNQNMKMGDLRRKTKREIGLRRILGHTLDVSDDEAFKHYEEYKKFYTSPEARRVIAITVFHRESPAPKALQSDRSEAEAKDIAENIRKSWVEDDKYVKMLWETKQYFIRGFDKPFGIPLTMKLEKNYLNVFGTPVGKISEVILDKNGFNIYKVVADLPARVAPFEEVKENVKGELIANKIEKSIQDGEFEKIKKKYKIERYLDLKDDK